MGFGYDSGLMDMETDTNPIDRSVAHLLFHRPSESPKINAVVDILFFCKNSCYY